MVCINTMAILNSIELNSILHVAILDVEAKALKMIY